MRIIECANTMLNMAEEEQKLLNGWRVMVVIVILCNVKLTV